MELTMKWMKNVILDIIITILIVIGYIENIHYVVIFLYIYSPLILVLRILALHVSIIKSNPKYKTPDLFIHFLYAANLVTLFLWNKWILLVIWLLIWILSYLYIRNVKKSKKKR